MRVLGLIVLFLAAACSESFLPAWAVTDLRAVAARVEVEGKPGRARPDPEDEIQVSILMIDEGAPASEVPAVTPPPLQWAFIACVPAPTLIGPPICRDLIQPCEGCEGAPPADPLDFPVLSFQVPSEAELEAAGADNVLLQGAICANGPPAADAILRFILGETDDLNPCEDPSNEGRFVTVNIPIETAPEDPNLNPEISTLFLNGRPWPPPYDQEVPRTAPRTGCRADLDGLTDQQRDAHPLAGSAASSINLGVTPDSLQSYVVGDMTLTEEIQVSWLTDGGDLERTFSFITDPARSVLTQWRPFSDAPEDGLLVRLTFVIRDGRGGTDWVERGLCVLPPPPAASPP
ncbi:MAG: hypothetical protein ACERNK_15680 [Deltaproteobacteria bacterium]